MKKRFLSTTCGVCSMFLYHTSKYWGENIYADKLYRAQSSKSWNWKEFYKEERFHFDHKSTSTLQSMSQYSKIEKSNNEVPFYSLHHTIDPLHNNQTNTPPHDNLDPSPSRVFLLFFDNVFLLFKCTHPSMTYDRMCFILHSSICNRLFFCRSFAETNNTMLCGWRAEERIEEDTCISSDDLTLRRSQLLLWHHTY